MNSQKPSSGAYLIIGPTEFFTANIKSILANQRLKLENNPNLVLIPEEKVGIDKIREVKKFFGIKKWDSKNQRVVLLPHAQGLSLEAQNALLKTLEELKPGNFIFLGAGNKEALLPTISSRCQIINSLTKKRALPKPPLNLKTIAKLPVFDRLTILKKPISAQDLNKTIAFYQRKLVAQKDSRLLKKWLEACLKAQQMLEANLRPDTVTDWLLLNL